ncbi:hypothetical protein MASR2M78_29670 [Treponema sp.]
MIITEEELRQAWRNGSGELPVFQSGTRFTPSALDFLSTLGPCSAQTDSQSSGGIAPGYGTAPGGELSLKPLTDGKRLIITTSDLDEILAARPATVVVHPCATVTDAARDILGKAGIKVTAAAPSSDTKIPDAGNLSADKQELLAAAKAAVMQRLGDRADPNLVGTVLQKITRAL